MSDKIRIMIVDDSAIIRSVLKRAILTQPDFEVVATANDGQNALDTLKLLPEAQKPHIVILDIQMPVMDGIAALPKLLEMQRGLKIIISSAISQSNAEITLKALDLGATDYIPKPSTSDSGADAINIFNHELFGKIRAHGSNALHRPSFTRTLISTPAATPAPAAKPAFGDETFTLSNNPVTKPVALAVASSTGGPDALTNFFKGLPTSTLLKYPVFVTQHMPPHFTKIMAENLTRTTGHKFKEAEEGEVIMSGTVYIAPGNYHMTAIRSGVNHVISLNQNAPENFCRPAADPMLRSLTELYGSKLLVVILTGMGADGAKGAQAAHEKGATIFAQDKESSVVWGMPGAAAKAGVCKKVLPLAKLPDAVMEVIR